MLHVDQIKYSKYHYNKVGTAIINNTQNGGRKLQVNLIQNYPYFLEPEKLTNSLDYYFSFITDWSFRNTSGK